MRVVSASSAESMSVLLLLLAVGAEMEDEEAAMAEVMLLLFLLLALGDEAEDGEEDDAAMAE